MTTSQTAEPEAPITADETLWETVKTIIYAVLLAVVIRTLIFEPFSIPSTSMVPTLLVGDYIIVSKYSYGYSRYSLPYGLPLFNDRVMENIPARGDVVVFKLPKNPRIDYIKRVIGLPGDQIQVRAGILYVNGKAVVRARLADYLVGDDKNKVRFMQYRETLPDTQKNHLILEFSDDAKLDNTPIFKVPEGHYFMMGDNRDNSMDSRVESSVGFVPAENLIGKAQFVFFSNKGEARWWEFWGWPWSIRFDRLFIKIE